MGDVHKASNVAQAMTFFDQLDEEGRKTALATARALYAQQEKAPAQPKQAETEPVKEKWQTAIDIAVKAIHTQIVDQLDSLNASITAVCPDMLDITSGRDSRSTEWLVWNYVAQIGNQIESIMENACCVTSMLEKTRL